MKLQEGETMIHEVKPESGILVIWFFTKCLPLVIVGTVLGSVLGLFLCGILGGKPASMFIVSLSLAFLVAPSLLLIGIIYCVFLRKTYLYYITSHRCVFHGGILRKVERSVPYHKVTDVETSQNIIERLLGISTLKIFTPGTGSAQTTAFGGQAAEITFAGLKDSETPADAINEVLRKFRATGQ